MSANPIPIDQPKSKPTSGPLEPRPIRQIIADLSKPLDTRHLATRVQGGQKLTYIPWHVANRALDHYAPGWSGRITNIMTTDKYLVLTYELTVVAAEGTFVRTATGCEELNMKGYGDPSSNAESMAFRRAAARFGLGLYLYDKTSH